MPEKKWTCALCGGEVVEGQRFTFLPGMGAVHVECLNERLLRKGGEAAALAAANEVLLYAIIRLKEAERAAEEGEVRSKIAEVRREVEKAAGSLAQLLSKHV